MKIDDAAAFLARVSVHGMRFEIHVHHGSIAGHKFVIYHRTIDSETLEPVSVAQSNPLPLDMISDEKDFARWIWKVITARYLHEAAEFFKIDGIAVHHPHRTQEEREILMGDLAR